MGAVKKTFIFLLALLALVFFTKISISFIKQNSFAPWVALCVGVLLLLLRLSKRSNSYYISMTSVVLFLYFAMEAYISWHYLPANPQNNYRGDLYILIPAILCLIAKSFYDFFAKIQYEPLLKTFEDKKGH